MYKKKTYIHLISKKPKNYESNTDYETFSNISRITKKNAV